MGIRAERVEPRRSRAATVLVVAALTEVAITLVAGVASGLSWARLVDLLVVSNALIGLALATSGWPIARHRPENPVGWCLLVGGCCYAFTGAGMAVLAWVAETGAEPAPWRVLATAVNVVGWHTSLTVLIPLALLLFPDGRLPGRRWRWLVLVVVANAVLIAALSILDPGGGLPAEVGIPGNPAWSATGSLGWALELWAAAIGLTLVGVLAALVTRYRRGDDLVRRQLLWLLLALLVVVVAFGVEALLGTDTLLLGILPLLLLPAAISFALLRHQLLDIRVVVSRTTVYLLLTVGVGSAYVALVSLLDALLPDRTLLGSSVLATLLVALAFNPARVWLHRRVHRMLYGARRDPAQVISAVTGSLKEVGAGGRPGEGLDGVLGALCGALRFPAAAIVVDRAEVATYADLPAGRHVLALGTGDEQVGELVVGLRSGESRLGAEDQRLLALLAAPLAVAVRADRLAGQLRDSRMRVISSREEERRRLRRELHDGLGPVLTGVVLNAGTALRLMKADPARSATLVAAVRDQAINSIEEVRRLAYDLRPSALDGMGLVGAVQEYAAVLSRGVGETPLRVKVEAAPQLPDLSAAVEVAAYRIATEALTNVVRHSTATMAVLRLDVGQGALELEIIDNGTNAGACWEPGVGLTSIRERTAELGGRSEIRHDRIGVVVRVSLPLPPGGGPPASAAATAAPSIEVGG